MSRKKKDKFKSKHHRKNKYSKKTGPVELNQHITNLLQANPDKSFSVKQIVKQLGIRDHKGKIAVNGLLQHMLNQGMVTVTEDKRYQSEVQPDSYVGVVDYVSPRNAFIICEEFETDVWIPTKDLKFAMDGDKVKIILREPYREGKRPEGKVIEILERSRKTFVGKVEISSRFAFVIPDYKKMYYDIFVRLDNLKGAKHNEKVVVELTQWPDKDRKPEGKVTRVLGKSGENEAEIHSIMAEFNLPFNFPKHVLDEAEKIEEDIASELKHRRDMRDITTFTIDPEDAKDFDDALSYRVLENGNYEIGVHIADVSHYVKPGTDLEEEAFKRATSVYLVDRTIPMLPERLSNQLCSLRPHEEKLTFSAVFEMTPEAKVVDRWFGRTVTYSDHRFTYDDAQAVIETGVGNYPEELKILNQLGQTLRKNRFKDGAINFETLEVKFKLDEKGKPLGIVPKIRKEAHFLIEEFMLLANRQVAEFVSNMRKGERENTFVYRTHDSPDPEKLQNFSAFAGRFGHQLKLREGTNNVSSQLNKLMDEIEGKPEQNVLESLAIRAMAKAKYTTESTSHFGLAFQHYTHFTSPIRRYPDVMVHRLLAHYLEGGKSVKQDQYEEKCEHSSEMEKVAANAERASIKYKQVEYMAYAEKKAYKGIITGVTEWGIFVELIETKCEGMVRLVDLNDDFYEFDEKNYRVIGRNNKRMYSLGDEVVVKVKHCDIDRRTIDLEFTEEDKVMA